MKLRIVPLTLKQANEMIAALHRHHKPVVGHRYSLGCKAGDTVVGAVVVGRPVSREIDQYLVCEVNRLVTDGTKNACSFLYAAAARVAAEMGFTKIQTYILQDEPGTSLRAAGWEYEAATNGGELESLVAQRPPHRSADGAEAALGKGA